MAINGFPDEYEATAVAAAAAAAAAADAADNLRLITLIFLFCCFSFCDFCSKTSSMIRFESSRFFSRDFKAVVAYSRGGESHIADGL